MSSFKLTECTSAHDFVSALRLSNEEWCGEFWSSEWIFRGQREAAWQLVPSAWRDGIKDHFVFQTMKRIGFQVTDETLDQSGKHCPANVFDPDGTRERIIQLKKQKYFEHFAVQEFVHFADSLGYSIPGGTFPEMDFFDCDKDLRRVVPPHFAYGLAQHHGVPTRLLDWTSSPLNAAFFATEGADSSASGDIAVWAINRSHLSQYDSVEFKIPRSHVGYLHAQDGTFTCIHKGNEFFLENGRWPAVDEVSHQEYGHLFLRKLVLPKECVPELQRLLWVEGISKAHLMPTLDNVHESLEVYYQNIRSTRDSNNQDNV